MGNVTSRDGSSRLINQTMRSNGCWQVALQSPKCRGTKYLKCNFSAQWYPFPLGRNKNKHENRLQAKTARTYFMNFYAKNYFCISVSSSLQSHIYLLCHLCWLAFMIITWFLLRSKHIRLISFGASDPVMQNNNNLCWGLP